MSIITPASAVISVSFKEGHIDGSYKTTKVQLDVGALRDDVEVAPHFGNQIMLQALQAPAVRSLSLKWTEGRPITSLQMDKWTRQETTPEESETVVHSLVDRFNRDPTCVMMRVALWSERQIRSWTKALVITGTIRPQPRLCTKMWTVEKTERELEGSCKSKIIRQVLSTFTLFSVTFFPKELSKPSVLFVQKEAGKVRGFLAPYLFKSAEVLSTFHVIRADSEEKISLQGASAYDCAALETCLNLFRQDVTSMAMCLTFMDHTATFVTCGWIKI